MKKFPYQKKKRSMFLFILFFDIIRFILNYLFFFYFLYFSCIQIQQSLKVFITEVTNSYGWANFH